MQLLERGLYQPTTCSPVPQRAIGTAQIGMNNGIENQTGRPNLSQAKLMLRTAVANGIEFFDTARAYEANEQVLGGCQ